VTATVRLRDLKYTEDEGNTEFVSSLTIKDSLTLGSSDDAVME